MLELLDENETITAEDVAWLFNNADIKIFCDCVTGDTKVLMADGSLKNIKDIKVGDEVITHLNRKRKITSVLSRPSYDDLLEIDLGDRKIKCTENHIFLVQNGNKKEWIKAKDLTEDMQLLELGGE